MSAYNVRVEFTNGKQSKVLTLQQAKKEYGSDELFEYLNGYHHDTVFFLENSVGEMIHPIPKDLF